MSEYQYVAFRAIDRAVSEKNLEYMRRQSSRAEITPWSFDNEYHYGDFHGNAMEMLRRGYDIHLHYTNFGDRTLMLRLPQGFAEPRGAKAYLLDKSLSLKRDKSGPGGVFIVEPFFEPGELEELWDLNELIDRLVPIRAEILAGDLRPLYLARLAVGSDGNHDRDEIIEGPIPAGLSQLTKPQQALAEFLGLGEALLAAAAQQSVEAPSIDEGQSRHAQWLSEQPTAAKDGWLARLMAAPDLSVRAEILASFRSTDPAQAWPTAPATRTIGELYATADEIQKEEARRADQRAARIREQQLAKMAANPSDYLRKADQLIEEQNGHAYRQAATMLADLREALASGDRAALAEEFAQRLKERYPTRRALLSELRKKGFLTRRELRPKKTTS